MDHDSVAASSTAMTGSTFASSKCQGLMLITKKRTISMLRSFLTWEPYLNILENRKSGRWEILDERQKTTHKGLSVLGQLSLFGVG